jgi:hypothetical protein
VEYLTRTLKSSEPAFSGRCSLRGADPRVLHSVDIPRSDWGGNGFRRPLNAQVGMTAGADIPTDPSELSRWTAILCQA